MGLVNSCPLCNKQYEVRSSDFHTEIAEMNDGAVISIVWAVCPICGREYIVSLGDENTSPIEKRLCELKAKALKMSYCGQKVHKKLKDKISAIDRKLSAMRKTLVDRYNNTLYLSKTDGETKDLCYLQQNNAGTM